MRRGEPVPATADALQLSVVEQLLSADVVVIGAPMYNYSMPSTLKTWLDRVHLPGVTAVPPPQPLAGRHAVIVTASGAAYDEGTPEAGWDHVVPPLQIVLGDSLGMTVHVVAARLTLAERIPEMAGQIERSREELARAESEIDALASTL